MNNILVTGAGGFIGAHLLNEFNKRNYKYFATTRKNGDIALNDTWNKFPTCNIVIHIAGKSYVPESWLNVNDFVDSNLKSTISALEYCKQRGSRLILLSSYMYGNPDFLPIAENAPIKIQNPYALTKKWAEEACEFYSNNFNIPITIFRPFNIYGPGQSSSFLLPHIISQLKKGEEIRVKDLSPKRDYLFVKDLIRALIMSLDLKLGFEVFNIGSGVSYSVGEIIDFIQKIYNTNLPVYSNDEVRKGEIFETIADISKAKYLLNWTPSWDIYTGLKETIKRQNS